MLENQCHNSKNNFGNVLAHERCRTIISQQFNNVAIISSTIESIRITFFPFNIFGSAIIIFFLLIRSPFDGRINVRSFSLHKASCTYGIPLTLE